MTVSASNIEQSIEVYRRAAKKLKPLYGVRSVERFSLERDATGPERVEFHFRKNSSPKSLSVSISFWEDRWASVRIWRHSALSDEKFSWTMSGRVVELARLFNAIAESARLGDYRVPELESIWSPILLTGPRGEIH
ncbi:hypothetical protein D3C80_1273790 [compost metagenome]